MSLVIHARDLDCVCTHASLAVVWHQHGARRGTSFHAAGEASCVSPPFLRRWHEFLAAVQKHIKSPQMEDQNVKVRRQQGCMFDRIVQAMLRASCLHTSPAATCPALSLQCLT